MQFLKILYFIFKSKSLLRMILKGEYFFKTCSLQVSKQLSIFTVLEPTNIPSNSDLSMLLNLLTFRFVILVLFFFCVL